jgi:hypothetical protein
MKNILFVLLGLVSSFAAIAQTKTTKDIEKNKNYQTLTERISGQWKLDRIVDSEESHNSQQGQKNEKNKGPKNPNDVAEVNSNQSNNAMQVIEFSDDARYKMNNSTTALDSGNYTLNEQNQSLVLESDLTASSPSEWNITLKNNTLTLIGREDASKRYKYIYSRMKQKALK